MKAELEKETVSLIITNKDAEYFIKKEIISAPDFVLSDEFLRKLKQLQYEHRISQR